MKDLQIKLPWPDRALSPNARAHYMTLYKAKKRAKATARLRVLEARGAVGARPWVKGEGGIRVDVVAAPPCNRNRDQDNLVASLKASLDGAAEGLCVNDSRFTLGSVQFLPPDPLDACVFLTFSPA